MRFTPFKSSVAVMAFCAGIGSMSALAQTPASKFPGIGTAPTDEDRGNLAWATGASGIGLPAGKGSAKEGETVYATKCMLCHGADLEGVRWSPGRFSPIAGPRLSGGNTTPRFTLKPGEVTTLAYSSPWPAVIFNTIAVEMPLFRPGTLTADETYSLTALVLFKNNLVKEDEVMNKDTLPKVQMPNRAGFPVSDAIFMDMKKRGCIQNYGLCRDKY